MNFLYINTHDTGRLIRPYGAPVNTPCLMSLAEEGVLFTRAFCCSPTCSPSRAAMLTGIYPHQNGMLGLAQRGFSLNDPSQHLAYWLQEHGYQTALSGIQHEYGWYLDIHPEQLHQMGYQDILTTSSKGYAKEDLYKWDHQNALAAVQWLKQVDKSKPFMLTYGMHSTHRPFPLKVSEDIDERYVQPVYPDFNDPKNRKDQAQFYTSVENADQNVGILLDAIRHLGLDDDTIVLFTTDHGPSFPFNKCTLTDRGLGVSLIIKGPGCLKGVVVDQLVSHIDIFPTVCELLGLPVPEYLEGESFADLARGINSAGRSEIYAEINFHTSYEPVRCIRTDRYLYVRYFDSEWDHINISNMDDSVPKDSFLAHGLRQEVKPREALYDCYYDPQEVNNLILDPAFRSIADTMRNKLEEQMKRTEDPLLKGQLPVLKNYKVNKRECIPASSKNPEDYDPRGRSV